MNDDCQHFYYQFAHLLSRNPELNKKNKFNAMPANVKWTVARYHLEKHYGLHDYNKNRGKGNEKKQKQCKPNMRMSFLTGYNLEDFTRHRGERSKMTQLEDGFYVRPDERIVLYRLPMPKGFDPYVPPELDNSENFRYATEEERLIAITEDAARKTNKDDPRMVFHASFFHSPRFPVPTNRHYICRNCYSQGHFTQFCQEERREMAKARQRVILPMPPGIPMTSMIPAGPQEDPTTTLFYDENKNIWKKKALQ